MKISQLPTGKKISFLLGGLAFYGAGVVGVAAYLQSNNPKVDFKLNISYFQASE
jgi:hypothetical protein